MGRGLRVALILRRLSLDEGDRCSLAPSRFTTTSTTMANTTDSASIEKQVSENESLPPVREKQPLSKRILRVVWDSLDKSPQERKLLVKIDCASGSFIHLVHGC